MTTYRCAGCCADERWLIVDEDQDDVFCRECGGHQSVAEALDATIPEPEPDGPDYYAALGAWVDAEAQLLEDCEDRADALEAQETRSAERAFSGFDYGSCR